MKTPIRTLISKVHSLPKLSVLVVLLSLPFLSLTPVWAGPNFSIVDTLGAATPSTHFSVFGSSASPIWRNNFVGPEFVLNQPTVITEIGGFVNNCGTITLGVPHCPNPLPIRVEIRPSINGLPDLTTILATFALPDDNDPLLWSYESVAPNLTLGAGTYFAIFATQGVDGSLLAMASNPFAYKAGLVNLGILDPTSQRAMVNLAYPAAVRILGLPAAFEVAIDISPGSPANVIHYKAKGLVHVAILSSATFDAPSQVDKNSLTFGKTGSEAPEIACDTGKRDVNRDGRLDLVCQFRARRAGFQHGDSLGILNGLTVAGVPFTGSDSVRIVP